VVAGGDLFGCAFDDDSSAPRAAFRSDVNQPVGCADHIEIVFDDDDGVAGIDETLQDFQQFADVGKVQSGGGFVEQVQGAAGGATSEFAGQFDALGFASGESG